MNKLYTIAKIYKRNAKKGVKAYREQLKQVRKANRAAARIQKYSLDLFLVVEE